MQQDVAILVYKQTILPHLDYCSFLVDGAKKTCVKGLQSLQNRALRVCARKYDRMYSTDKLHAICDIERLNSRREMQLALFMYKRAQRLNLRPVDNPRTRGDLKIKFPTYRRKLQKYKRSPLFRGITLWNRITPGVQQAKSKASFKRQFRETPLDPPNPDL